MKIACSIVDGLIWHSPSVGDITVATSFIYSSLIVLIDNADKNFLSYSDMMSMLKMKTITNLIKM